MAATVLTFALCTVAGKDIVGELSGISATLSHNILDVSNLGIGTNVSRLPGLGDFQVTLTTGHWDADESAADGLGKALWDGSLFAASPGTSIYTLVVSRLAVPTAAARRYTMEAVIMSGWDPFGATVGEVVGGSNGVTFGLADSVITVATS